MRGRFRCIPIVSITAAALAMLVAGCGSDPASRPKAASGRDGSEAGATAQAAGASASKGGASADASSVHIDDRIVKACGNIPKAHFAFDSSYIQSDAASSLDALARCFSSGNLAGKGMRVVGHADARGETEYNFGLGHKRASTVASFLGKKGVEASRLQTSSRGELEASGGDEEGWARDRRVDIFLAD
ncbi:MAG TPA: OmpA family protein [Polyangium sp.]|nr:OmpA family protein [Polyangium sp.]